jgi:hypothetical protein
MTTTTIHIRSVFVDSFTILLRFLNIFFILKSLSLFRFIVFFIVFFSSTHFHPVRLFLC